MISKARLVIFWVDINDWNLHGKLYRRVMVSLILLRNSSTLQLNANRHALIKRLTHLLRKGVFCIERRKALTCRRVSFLTNNVTGHINRANRLTVKSTTTKKGKRADDSSDDSKSADEDSRIPRIWLLVVDHVRVVLFESLPIAIAFNITAKIFFNCCFESQILPKTPLNEFF